MERLERLWNQFSVPLLPNGLGNFLPNLAVTVTIGIVMGAWLSVRLGLPRRTAGALWLTCMLLPLAYTLSAARGVGVAGCEVGLAPWASITALFSSETRSNIIMLMPAGAAALLFPTGPRRLAALGAALALPPAIELTQMAARPLGRACQGADVFNNMVGVMLGFCLASGVWVIWASLTTSQPSAIQASPESDFGRSPANAPWADAGPMNGSGSLPQTANVDDSGRHESSR